jgi:hypothetical protein
MFIPIYALVIVGFVCFALFMGVLTEKAKVEKQKLIILQESLRQNTITTKVFTDTEKIEVEVSFTCPADDNRHIHVCTEDFKESLNSTRYGTISFEIKRYENFMARMRYTNIRIFEALRTPL